MITKIWSYADERRAALIDLGFKPAADKLIGNDGTEYGDYYFLDMRMR